MKNIIDKIKYERIKLKIDWNRVFNIRTLAPPIENNYNYGKLREHYSYCNRYALELLNTHNALMICKDAHMTKFMKQRVKKHLNNQIVVEHGERILRHEVFYSKKKQYIIGEGFTTDEIYEIVEFMGKENLIIAFL